MERLKWYFKQLFPLTYTSVFRENGQRKLCIWKMWLAHSYDKQYFDLADKT